VEREVLLIDAHHRSRRPSLGDRKAQLRVGEEMDALILTVAVAGGVALGVFLARWVLGAVMRLIRIPGRSDS
jgi:hypothetical protein